MLILGVESPAGEKTYVAAAFPSACGKTNFAMLIPPPAFAGWKVTTVGDDIAWIKPGPDGRLYAINPEFGFFGVAPGTSRKSNPNAMATLARNCIFTNVALTEDGDVWWEDMTEQPPARLIDWQGQPWTPGCGRKAAHPNARFTVPAAQCPSIDDRLGEARGRADLGLHLRRPPQPGACRWSTRRSTGPMACMPPPPWARRPPPPPPARSARCAAIPSPCCRSAATTSATTSTTGWRWAAASRNPPRIFCVNWFRKGADGKFLWPGYGENMRVLKWIVDRCHGARQRRARACWAGCRARRDLEWSGLESVPDAQFAELMAVERDTWIQELLLHEELFVKLYDKLPKEFVLKRELLLASLWRSPERWTVPD